MWPNPQETEGLVTITEEIVNGNIFCAVSDIGCGLHFQIYTEALAAWKASKYGVISGPYFSTFGLNTERYFVSLRIQSECGKIRIRKTNSKYGHFCTQWETCGNLDNKIWKRSCVLFIFTFCFMSLQVWVKKYKTIFTITTHMQICSNL